MRKNQGEALRARLKLAKEQEGDGCPVCTDPNCLVRAGSIAATEHWRWYRARALAD